ncbi:MAG TPA: DUF5107 domain-containing protein [Capsulimonadaceae bacterium]|jgi:tetratricopeptide (TPR) repeat protein
MPTNTKVTVIREAISMPTYEPMPPDRNPMFLEQRVYQGSSGRVYPLPYYDRIEECPTDKLWDSVRVENEYISVVILPELGGRIHVGRDRTNGYDFFYNQKVIKPALVGLAGPWISGGVEFNWPQHHRPATYMPVDVAIEEHEDGSVTAWFSDHDPMTRMKGMHGVCIHPGKSYLELKVRLYNRTLFTQTFLWWANLGVRVHDDYQSFFPPDVHFVADHAKRAVSEFPVCRGYYYGVDYSPGTRLDWFKNIPVPTSYMAVGSVHDFVGGYDDRSRAGLVHVANHHISPGKKQWTWGDSEFGHRWYRHLTDNDGPYIELMAGVYTDNQPDFSFLSPGETKSFSQYWYPFQEIGPLISATIDAAISLTGDGPVAHVGVVTTAVEDDVITRVTLNGRVVSETRGNIAPDKPLLFDLDLVDAADRDKLAIDVVTSYGRTLVCHQPPAPASQAEAPEPATEPPRPEDVTSNDELYLIGLHLDQYRHATRDPELYWLEALGRDEGDYRCNNALGSRCLRRGEFDAAVGYFRKSITRLTSRNPNPADGEPYYNLGLALRFSGEDHQAYSAFYKATWNAAWAGPAYHALAEIDGTRAEWTKALEHIDRSLRANTENNRARNLRASILRKLGRNDEANAQIAAILAVDPLDWWARFQATGALECSTQTRLDVALDCVAAGLLDSATAILSDIGIPETGTGPIVKYLLADIASRRGDAEAAKRYRDDARQCPKDYCFPSRLEEMTLLQRSLAADPHDARAMFYLGNLLYDKRRRSEAIALWQQSVAIDSTNSIAWRNLGIGLFNVNGDADGALDAYRAARNAAPDDARVLFEQDQLMKRTGVTPSVRLAELEKARDLVKGRDDLTIELCALCNQLGHSARALDILASRTFQPWEGGEGTVLAQYSRAHVNLGRESMASGDVPRAIEHLLAALSPPENLGESVHPLANRSDIYYWLGEAQSAAGNLSKAKESWQTASEFKGDFQDMAVLNYSEMTYYQALALQRLGHQRDASSMFEGLRAYAQKLALEPGRIDYFATSLPTMLLFVDDLDKRQAIRATLLEALAELGLGNAQAAQSLLGKVLDLDPNNAIASDLGN